MEPESSDVCRTSGSANDNKMVDEMRKEWKWLREELIGAGEAVGLRIVVEWTERRMNVWVWQQVGVKKERAGLGQIN